MSGLIRLGLIGCGGVTAQFHTPALLQTKRLSVRGLHDVRAESARQVAAHFESAKLYDRAEELFDDPSIDAVGILTPPASHPALAEAALRAGKHVLVEKPLALTTQEGRRLVAIAQECGLVCAVGYHLRQHRFVRRAREAIDSRRLGRLSAVHSLWSSSMFQESELGTWRAEERSGGNLLYELGVHHLDLWRYLLGEELRALHAEKLQVGEASARVQLVTRSQSGVLVHVSLVSGALDAQELEIVGEQGTIRFSLYDALSYRECLASQPQFGIGARVNQLRATLAEIPEGLAHQLRGGDLPTCFHAQWESFADAVLLGARPTAGFEDGYAAIELVESAYGSSLRQIDLQRRRPLHSEPETADASGEEVYSAREAYSAGADDHPPELSVVLASPDTFSGLKATLAHLRAQTIRERMEVVLVAPRDAPFTLDQSCLEGFHGWQEIRVPSMPTIAHGNAAGIRHARAKLVALAEDHCFPEPGWAQALVAAQRQGYTVVAPVVRNANPNTKVSWADYLAGYGPWIYGLPDRQAEILPGHNSCYQRSVLLGLGEDLEAYMESEAVLHMHLRTRGHRLLLEPRAVTAHVNFALFDSWISASFFGGRVFAGIRSQQWNAARRILYCLASPAIPYVRLWRSVTWMRQASYAPSVIFAILPHLWLGLTVDGMGQTLGYLAGEGSACAALAHFEFHRAKHVPRAEREVLFEQFERA